MRAIRPPAPPYLDAQGFKSIIDYVTGHASVLADFNVESIPCPRAAHGTVVNFDPAFVLDEALSLIET